MNYKKRWCNTRNLGIHILCGFFVSTMMFVQGVPVCASVQESQPERLQIGIMHTTETSDGEDSPIVAENEPRKVKNASSEELEEQRVYVHRYVFDGKWPLEKEKLLQAVSGNPEREMGFRELEGKAMELTRCLRFHGYFVATAYIPLQDFSKGSVHFAQVLGNYEDVLIQNTTSARKCAISRELGRVRAGEVIERNHLERGILLAGDLPRTNIKTFLQAGQSPGTTDLVVKAERKGDDFWGYAGFDNGGYRYTGRYQYSLFMNYANPFQAGDLLTFGGVVSPSAGEMWSGTVSYVAPILFQGLKLGLSYGRSHYGLGGEFSHLGYTGKSDSFGIYLQQNIKRSRIANSYFTIRYDAKNLSNEIKEQLLEQPKAAHNWSFTLHGDVEDKLFSGGKNQYSFSYTAGKLRLDDSVSRAADAVFAQTAGRFDKYGVNLSRLQRVNDNDSLTLSYTRQWASKNLDSSEKISLGGPYGVRAYPLGEASGDEGWLWSAEYRHLFPHEEGAKDVFQFTAFIDGGRVVLYKNLWPSYYATATKQSRALYGAGIGLHWSNEGNWIGKIQYAWRIGDEEVESDRNRKGRIWFQIYRMF